MLDNQMVVFILTHITTYQYEPSIQNRIYQLN